MAAGAMGASMPLYSTLTMLVTLSYPGGSTPGVWPSTETLPFRRAGGAGAGHHRPDLGSTGTRACPTAETAEIVAAPLRLCPPERVLAIGLDPLPADRRAWGRARP